jgi:predicted acylesterase/phospholipase RssA
MRVAWQSGVVQAVLESGLTFAHGDGTSGGIFTLGMLLSGLSPDEMCERWRTLDVGDFTSFMPIGEYLKGPTNFIAVGSAEGLVEKVYPHLGIDVARIHSARGMDGTFNVCDFTDKVIDAVPHTEIDVDLLVAGMSLPIFLPPVAKGDRIYTDAVWIKDANLTEALRRGAEEIWLVWCIGNTGRYATGPLEQYVHMIEMSANGALFWELELIADVNRRRAAGEVVYGSSRPTRVHVVKPEYPLPLDPDFYLGRIRAETLVAMGYRDACRYLESLPAEGVALDAGATKMREPPLGVRFTERFSGTVNLDGTEGEVTLDVGVEIHDLAAATSGDLVGRIHFAPWGEPLHLAGGRFGVVTTGPDGDTTTEVLYEASVHRGGKALLLRGVKRLHDDPGFDLMSDATTLHLVHEDSPDAKVVASGSLRAGLGDVRRTVSSLEPTGAHDLSDRASVVATVGRRLLGRLWADFT